MSQGFENIIGHNFNIKHLCALAENNRLPHALVFIGKEGIGKRTIAEALSKIIIGSTAMLLPDVHYIAREKDKKEISVDSMRELCSKLLLKPYSGVASVAIIDDAHRMNISAANALLMTLEEPSKHAHIILITSAPQKLPETIISRCQPIYFTELSETEIEKIISLIITDEEAKTSCKKLLKYLDGSLAPLLLNENFDSTTRTLNQEKLLKHFNYLEETYLKISALTSKLIAYGLEENYADLICQITAILADKEEVGYLWNMLYKTLRNELRSNEQKMINKVSSVFSNLLNAEILSTERNANTQLQIFSSF